MFFPGDQPCFLFNFHCFIWDIKSGTSILGLKSKSGSLRLPVWASGHYQTGTLWKVELYQQILKILPLEWKTPLCLACVAYLYLVPSR